MSRDGTTWFRFPFDAQALAEATGAKTLITACQKCQIHLTCALSNLEMGLELKDLTSLLAEAIK